MKNKSTFTLATLVLAMGITPIALLSGQARASGTTQAPSTQTTPTAATTPAKQEFVRNEMVKLFNDSQDLLTKKQYPEAAEKINALNAFERKTPFEQFQIDRLSAILAAGSKNTQLLAMSFDSMIKSGYLSKPEILKFTEGAAGTYFNEKQYAKAKEWIGRYLELDDSSTEMQELLARTLYLQEDYTGAIQEINRQIQHEDAANKIPSYDKLYLLISAYLKLKDMDGYTKVLERMVAHYPKKEYWADLIYRLPNKPGFSDRLRLDYYRLLLATDTMEELFLLAGLPAEAKKVVDAGYAANMLGTGKDAAKHKLLRDKVNKQAADDLKSLDAGEATAKASKNGIGLVNTGYNFVINGQADRGIGLMEQGIAKGGLKAPEEAKLHLGMAYLQAGNKPKASEIFKSIQSADGSADIGKFWLLMKPQ
jgi:lipopolysaccharide biosynthesis regulator YciM